MPPPPLAVEHVDPRSLVPAPYNPRTITPDAMERLCRSLREFGFVEPVVARRSDRLVIGGHQRLAAAERLGMAEVPVAFVEIDDDRARALNIALNNPALAGTYDEAKLAVLLLELEATDIGTILSGFDASEVERILAEAEAAALDPKTAPDDVPEPPAEPVTRPGDLWILGHHRLLCGDSTKPEDVARVMAGKKAALVATDPPYLVDYTGERPNDSGKDWSASYREIDIVDADAFFRSVFRNVLSVLAPKAALYCWHAHKRSGLIQRVWEDLGILDHQQVVWVKPTPVFGRVYWHFRHEPCVMGWVKGEKPEHDGNHEYDSVWEVDWEGKARVVGNEHPTEKPVELFARPMRKHTRAGDVCFEPFSGSGSQIIAGERLGRRVHALELEPRFVDVAVTRWEKFTGRQAVREESPRGDS